MNADSSRSHSIFSITIETSQRREGDAEDDEPHITVGKLNLVDLAVRLYKLPYSSFNAPGFNPGTLRCNILVASLCFFTRILYHYVTGSERQGKTGATVGLCKLNPVDTWLGKVPGFNP
jgi:hypothetical protein